MGILNELKKYDASITVAELIQKIKSDRLEQEKIEELELTEIKEEFENTYLKEVDEYGLFGRTVNIYHLKNFVRKERTEDWSFSYYFKGKRIQFEKYGVLKNDFETNRVGDGFSV